MPSSATSAWLTPSPAGGCGRVARSPGSGRAQAAIYVGDAFANGLSKTPEDCGKAIEWYNRAWELGSELAAYKLGEPYSAYGCAKYDAAAARDWYGRAVELGDQTGAHQGDDGTFLFPYTEHRRSRRRPARAWDAGHRARAAGPAWRRDGARWRGRAGCA